LSAQNPLENILGSPEHRAQTLEHLRSIGRQEINEEEIRGKEIKEKDVTKVPVMAIFVPLPSVPPSDPQTDPRTDPFVYIKLSPEETGANAQDAVQDAIILPSQHGKHMSFPLLTLKNRVASPASNGSQPR
jgi:hypothetical protein